MVMRHQNDLQANSVCSKRRQWNSEHSTHHCSEAAVGKMYPQAPSPEICCRAVAFWPVIGVTNCSKQFLPLADPSAVESPVWEHGRKVGGLDGENWVARDLPHLLAQFPHLSAQLFDRHFHSGLPSLQIHHDMLDVGQGIHHHLAGGVLCWIAIVSSAICCSIACVRSCTRVTYLGFSRSELL